MATIRIKTGSGIPTLDDLDYGEFALDEDTGYLYIRGYDGVYLFIPDQRYTSGELG